MTQKLGLNKGKRSSRSKSRRPLNLNSPCTLASTPSQTVFLFWNCNYDVTRSRIHFAVMFNPHQNLDRISSLHPICHDHNATNFSVSWSLPLFRSLICFHSLIRVSISNFTLLVFVIFVFSFLLSLYCVFNMFQLQNKKVKGSSL
jgi:hypothetical protein